MDHAAKIIAVSNDEDQTTTFSGVSDYAGQAISTSHVMQYQMIITIQQQ